MRRAGTFGGVLAATAAAALFSGCTEEDYVVASDTQSGLERIEDVDILLVVDSSVSITPAADRLKEQLPRLVNAIVSGSDEETDAFPAARSVHVAVATSDMGIGGAAPMGSSNFGCSVLGDDGVFLTPAQAELSCDVSYPGYLSFDGEAQAAIATVDTVACVPLVGVDGCGFEQPLEAALKSLTPADDDSISFLHGEGHGDGANEGFLRDDSLLVVVVVTDEDDCSSDDVGLYDPMEQTRGPVNTRCAFTDALYDIERYVDGLQRLREDSGDLVFGVIGGVPPGLLEEASAERADLGSEAQAEAYFERLLDDPRMQPSVAGDPQSPQATLLPSCVTGNLEARPPTRLVETAAAFGTRGVVGSLCDEDFGAPTGALLRAIAERMRSGGDGAGAR